VKTLPHPQIIVLTIGNQLTNRLEKSN
jgi:hypothetical protein